MLVQIEVEYTATPPVAELETMRKVGEMLTSSPKSVSVNLLAQSKFPTIVLEFQIKTQAEDKVVDQIFNTVQMHTNGQLYRDMLVRFPKKPKRSQ